MSKNPALISLVIKGEGKKPFAKIIESVQQRGRPYGI
jgi:hypothetical protein